MARCCGINDSCSGHGSDMRIQRRASCEIFILTNTVISPCTSATSGSQNRSVRLSSFITPVNKDYHKLGYMATARDSAAISLMTVCDFVVLLSSSCQWWAWASFNDDEGRLDGSASPLQLHTIPISFKSKRDPMIKQCKVVSTNLTSYIPAQRTYETSLWRCRSSWSGVGRIKCDSRQ